MTVKELKEAIKDMPDDAEVFRYSDYAYIGVRGVKLRIVDESVMLRGKLTWSDSRDGVFLR